MLPIWYGRAKYCFKSEVFATTDLVTITQTVILTNITFFYICLNLSLTEKIFSLKNFSG